MSGLLFTDGSFPVPCGAFKHYWGQYSDISGLSLEEIEYQYWDGETLYFAPGGDADVPIPSRRSDIYIPVVGPQSLYPFGTESLAIAVKAHWAARSIDIKLNTVSLSAEVSDASITDAGHYSSTGPSATWINTPFSVDSRSISYTASPSMAAVYSQVPTRDGADGFPDDDIRTILVSGRDYDWRPDIYTPPYVGFLHSDSDYLDEYFLEGRVTRTLSIALSDILINRSYEAHGGGFLPCLGLGVVPFVDGKYWFPAPVRATLQAYANRRGSYGVEDPDGAWPWENTNGGGQVTRLKRLNLGEWLVPSTSGDEYVVANSNVGSSARLWVSPTEYIDGTMNAALNEEGGESEAPAPGTASVGASVGLFEIYPTKYYTLGGRIDESTGELV